MNITPNILINTIKGERMKEDYPYPTLKNNPLFYNDQRPLTDEKLKELGFSGEKGFYWYRPTILNPDEKTYLTLRTVINQDKVTYSVTIDDKTYWKTVGSVRMLIEALKGDK